MTDVEVGNFLADVVKKWNPAYLWGEDMRDGVTLTYEKAYTTVSYSDLGVGEEYVVQAFRQEWPGRQIEIDEWGGCESCGFGRTVSIVISGPAPWMPLSSTESDRRSLNAE